LGAPPSDDGLSYFYDSIYQRGFVADKTGLRISQVSTYQLRSPNEWFAELYAYYYADPRQPGRLLRRRGPILCAIANWFDAVVNV
jgi:hypothetical protein